MTQFAVIGMGRFGKHLAINLAQAGAQVIAIDNDHQLIEHMRDRVTLAVSLDATDEDALKLQGVQHVDVAIVGIGENFEANLLCTVILKKLNVPKVIARANSTRRAEILERIGADAVVSPEFESADRWTLRLLSAHLVQQIPIGDDHSLQEMKTPKAWINQSLADLKIRAVYNVNIVLLKRPNPNNKLDVAGEPVYRYENPTATSKLVAEDHLLIVGKDEDLKNLPE